MKRICILLNALITIRRHTVRKCFLVLCAVITLVAASGRVGASPMDWLSWWTYDSFPGPSLNTNLWQLSPNSDYLSCAVNNGLTVITSSDHAKFSLTSTYNINTGNFFAAKFSFNVLASVQSGGMVDVTTDIGAPSVPNSSIPISWAWAQNYQGFSGKCFVSGPDNNPIFASTNVTQGQLGFIYNGTSVSMYYNDGSGWQMLYSVNPGWSGPLMYGLGVEIKGPPGSSMTTTFTNVQFATSASGAGLPGWDLINLPSVSPNWYLYGVHFTSPTEGWAVGYDGTNHSGVLLHYSGGTWTPVTPPSVSSQWDLSGVHFTSASNGWAVGMDYINGRGVLLHYSGKTWTSVIPPSVSPNWHLYGVHFTSAGNGWAVGSDSANARAVLLHYSKNTWIPVTPPSVSSYWYLQGVHFTSATEGWAVGQDNTNSRGVLLHYSGDTWTSVTPPSVGPNWYLRGVHFTSPTEGWAVGGDNTNGRGGLLHYSGGTWTSVTPPSVSSNWWLFGVHFTSANEGWAVGYDGTSQSGVLLYYSWGSWTSVTPPSVSPAWELFGVHFTLPNEGWAVGTDYGNARGALLHFSIWPMSFSSRLTIKGFAHDSNVTDGWCHIYSDGTFILHDQVINRSYTGTYTIVPGGKSILFTLDANGLSEMQAMLTDWLTEMGANTGIVIQNISLVFNQVSISKGTIQKKTNAPGKVTVKITGTMSALVGGINKVADFSYQSNLKYHSP